MPVIHLESLADPRVADYHAIRDQALLQTKDLFVAEGRLVVERVVRARRFAIVSILVSETASGALEDALQAVDPAVPIYVGPSREFRDIGGLNMHRGCLALVERPPSHDVSRVLASARRVVALDAVANPDNIGGIFRSAAAFGVDAVLLDPRSSDPLYRKAIRTSMAAALTVPFARFGDWHEIGQRFRTLGFEVVATTPQATALPVARYARTRRHDRVALLFGAEGDGLSDAALAVADVRVRIPIRDEVDSLNVSAAAAVVLAMLSAEP